MPPTPELEMSTQFSISEVFKKSLKAVQVRFFLFFFVNCCFLMRYFGFSIAPKRNKLMLTERKKELHVVHST